MEEESDGRLAFLDVQLKRSEDGTVSTSVYRKATHTNQYLVFESHHPVAHKVAVVKILISRAQALSSSGVEWAQEKKEISALRNGDVAASALAEYALVAGHGIDLSKTEVVDSNPYTVTWCMLENKTNRE